MRQYSYKDISAKFTYTIGDENLFLVEENSGLGYGNRFYYYLKEYSPVYSLTRVSGRKNMWSGLGAILVVIINFGLAISAFVTALGAEWVCIAIALGLLFTFLACRQFFLMIRNRGCFVYFRSMFRDDVGIRIVYPYASDISKSEFIHELQRVLAGQFLVRRPDLNNPAVAKDIGGDFERLCEDGIISDDELSTLNKRVFGASVIRNKIGFGSDE